MSSLNPWEDMGKLREWIGAFRAESDRAAAVLGACYLESLLQELLASTFIENLPQAQLDRLFGSNGPFGTFASCTDAAFALGFLAKEEHRDLGLVRQIRNDFAHDTDHKLSFASQHIADRCRALRFPQFIIDNNHLDVLAFPEATLNDMHTRPRRRFEVAVGALMFLCPLRARGRARPSPALGIAERVDMHQTQVRQLQRAFKESSDPTTRAGIAEQLRRLGSLNDTRSSTRVADDPHQE